MAISREEDSIFRESMVDDMLDVSLTCAQHRVEAQRTSRLYAHEGRHRASA